MLPYLATGNSSRTLNFKSAFRALATDPSEAFLDFRGHRITDAIVHLYQRCLTQALVNATELFLDRSLNESFRSAIQVWMS